ASTVRGRRRARRKTAPTRRLRTSGTLDGGRHRFGAASWATDCCVGDHGLAWPPVVRLATRTFSAAGLDGDLSSSALEEGDRGRQVAYGYDGNGNMTSRGALAFQYDAENRLVR